MSSDVCSIFVQKQNTTFVSRSNEERLTPGFERFELTSFKLELSCFAGCVPKEEEFLKYIMFMSSRVSRNMRQFPSRKKGKQNTLSPGLKREVAAFIESNLQPQLPVVFAAVHVLM